MTALRLKPTAALKVPAAPVASALLLNVAVRPTESTAVTKVPTGRLALVTKAPLKRLVTLVSVRTLLPRVVEAVALPVKFVDVWKLL